MRAGWLAALLLGGCAMGTAGEQQREARAKRDFAEATRGYVEGKPQTCVDSARLDGPQIVAPDTLVYRDVGRLWVARSEGCPFLNDRDAIIIAEVYGSQLCRNDGFYTVQRGGGIPGPRCRFIQFTPWTKAR